jgi:predicted O-linked N-acetylglucosamine transferase (SPINDLY family)
MLALTALRCSADVRCAASCRVAFTALTPAVALQVFVYDSTPRPDSKSQYLKDSAEAAGATWRHITGSSHEDVAALIRQDRVDVLVELTGHTANNRLAVMCYKPAPVQMTWIGYPNSTGLEAVGYRCISYALGDCFVCSSTCLCYCLPHS